MRLIDVDEVIEYYEMFKGERVPVDILLLNLRNEPTAYDPNKIVEQLKNKARTGSVMESPGISRTSMFVQINDAIEIVKGISNE